MEVLVFCLVVAAFVQRVAADWWAGVTGRPFPSQQYRMKRLEMRAQRYAAAGKQLPARGPARQYASDMWALAWQTASKRHADWWERHEAKRQERKQQKQDQPHPMRDYFRIVWKTGPARRWHDAWQRAIDKRQRKLAAAGEPADQQIPESADGRVIPFRKRGEAKEPPPEQRETDPEERLRAGWLKAYHTKLNEIGDHEYAKDYADFCAERYRDLDPQYWPEMLLSGGRHAFLMWRREREQQRLAELRKEQEKRATRNGRNPSGHEENDHAESSDDNSRHNGNGHNGSEGKSMSTTTTVNSEVTGLESAIRYVEAMAQSTRAGVSSIETAMAGLLAGQVSGPALTHLTAAQEQLAGAATSFENAAVELNSQRGVKEAYEATPGAGSREFVTGE